MGIKEIGSGIIEIGSGLRRFLKKNPKFELFEPKASLEAAEKYTDSLGSKKTKLTSSTNVFEDYKNNRISSIYDLAKLTKEDEKDPKIRHQSIKTPDGSSLADKLKPAKPGTPLTTAQMDTIEYFKNALSFEETMIDPATNKSRIDPLTNKSIPNPQTQFKRDFEDDISDLNNVIKKEPEKFDMAAIASYLQKLRTTAEEGLQAQHKHEKDAISKLFEKPSQSRTDIEASMGLTTDDVDKFKQTILAELEISHKAQLDAFNKTTGDEIKALYRAANEDRDRINALSIMDKNSFNRRRINELIKNRPDKPEDDVPTLAFDGKNLNSARFKNIDVNDMDIIQTITGRKMTHNKEENSYSMELPHFGLLYYKRRSDQIDYDFTSMAQAIKACGFQSIKFEVNYKDEAYAMELARKQFEAACRAGFDPTETKDPKDPNKTTCRIKCVVNGKEIPIEELFKSHQQRLQTARANAARDKPERMAYSKEANQHFKNLEAAVKEEKDQRLQKSP